MILVRRHWQGNSRKALTANEDGIISKDRSSTDGIISRDTMLCALTGIQPAIAELDVTETASQRDFLLRCCSDS